MSESSKTIANDLASPAGIQAYLQTLLDGRFAAKSVDVVSGGFANYTFRAWLETPYESTTHTRDIPVEKASVIVKYATEYAAASGSTIPLNLNRTDIEVTALRIVSRSFLGEDYKGPDKIYIPALLHYDAEKKIQIHGDFGALPSLKEWIIAHPTHSALSNEIGNRLGTFLARLHLWGQGVVHGAANEDEKTEMEQFKNNATSRQLCAWRTGGRLAEVATEYGLGSTEEWTKLVQRLGEDVLEGNETYNMGDFWTGNILVKATPEASGEPALDALVVLDWELSKTGLAATDVAQFSAESYLLHKLSSPPNRAGGDLVSSFLSGYAKTLNTVPLADRKFGFDVSTILAHLAAHAAVWGQTVSWAKDDAVSGISGKDITKQTVEKALGLCLRAGKREMDVAEEDATMSAARLVDTLN